MNKLLPAVLAVLAVLGCDRSAPGKALPAERVRVSYTTQPQSALIHVAVAKGFFGEEGLVVEPLLHTFGKASLQSLLDGKSDFATVAETPVMFSILKGDKICLIANIEASPLNNGIVGRKDAGISGPADLKGKRIAYTPGTTSDFFLDSLLTTIGVTRQAIVPVAVKPDDMKDAILGRKVDAVCTWNYPLTQIKHLLGANATLIIDREIYTETYNVATQQAFARQHPETVKRFLRAMVKAERFVAQNPPEAQAIMAAASGTELALVREVWDTFRYRLLLDETLPLTLEDETRWAMKNKLTDQTVMPNYSDYINADGLLSVKPESVHLRR